MFQIQKVSDYGAGVPVVARTLLQATQLMDAFSVPDETKSAAKDAVFGVYQKLIHCYEIYDNLRREIDDARREGFHVQRSGTALTVPSIVNVENRAESFLQSAKLAISNAGQILNPFFERSFDHRFDKILTWAQREFGADHDISQTIAHWEPSVRAIVEMRNAVDHPSSKPRGRLIVRNFYVSTDNGSTTLMEPTWCLSDESPTLLVTDMDTIIENILTSSEDVLSACLLHTCKRPIGIYEIPLSDRDPKCPIRLRPAFE